MIYYYNSKKNQLSNAFGATNLDENPKSRPSSAFPLKKNRYYNNESVTPVADYKTDIINYRGKSQTHSRALDFKVKNTLGQGFEVLNSKNDFEDELMFINRNGETFQEFLDILSRNFFEFGFAPIEVKKIDDRLSLYAANPASFNAILNKRNTRVLKWQFKNYYNGFARKKRISNSIQKGRVKNFLFPIKMPSPVDKIFGYPDWLSAKIAIEICYGIDLWINGFIENNARFDFLVVTTGGMLDNDQREELKNGLKGHLGKKNKGKSGYLDLMPDSTIEVIELNNVDHSSFLNGKNEYIQQIAQAHGLSPSTLGTTTGGNSLAGNELVGALRKDENTYLKPSREYLQSKLNQLFYMLLGYNPKLVFKPMQIASAKEQAVINQMEIADGIISPSYVRNRNYPDITEEEMEDLRIADEEVATDLGKEDWDNTGETGGNRTESEVK